MLANRASVCLRRLEALADDSLVALLAHGISEQARQTNLYAMMRSYRLMWDFMINLVGGRYRTLDFHLSRSDISRFITQWCADDPKTAAWSESTRCRIGGTLVNALVACGHLATSRAGELRPVLLDGEVGQGILRNGDEVALAAFGSLNVGELR